VPVAPSRSTGGAAPTFCVTTSHLDEVQIDVFVYDDDVVEALLRSVYDDIFGGRPAERFLLRSSRTLLPRNVCFTYTAHGGTKQHVVAQYGTLVLGENCAACDSVCQHNPEPGHALTILDLAKDERTKASKLVAAGPRLKSYSGARLTPELSMIVLVAGPHAMPRRLADACQRALGRCAPVAAPLVAKSRFTLAAPPSSALHEPTSASPTPAADVSDEIAFVVDRRRIVVRASRLSREYFGVDALVGKDAATLLAAEPASRDRDVEEDPAPRSSSARHAARDTIEAAEDARRNGTTTKDDAPHAAARAFLRLLSDTPTAAGPLVVENVVTANGKKADLRIERLRRVTVVRVHDVSVSEAYLREKRQELDIQRRLLGQIAHELRNKFAASICVMEDLRDAAGSAASDADAGRAVTTLLGDVQDAVTLLREADQLITTRLELHRMLRDVYASRPNRRVVRLRDHVETLVAPFRRHAHDDVTLDVSVEESDPDGSAEPVAVDTYVLEHVLATCLYNALKVTTRGAVGVTLHAIDAVTAQRGVFGVRDSGPGLAEGLDVETLFDHGVFDGADRGSGLGLASADLFLRAVGGRIWVASTCRAAGTSHTDIRFEVPVFFAADEAPLETSATNGGGLLHEEHPATTTSGSIHSIAEEEEDHLDASAPVPTATADAPPPAVDSDEIHIIEDSARPESSRTAEGGVPS